MPILLPIKQDSVSLLSTTEPILLTNDADLPHALVTKGSKYQLDLEDLAKRWFGTNSLNHPGVAEVMSYSGWFLAGPIVLLNRIRSPDRHCELTPAQARYVFTYKGWAKV